MDKVYQSEKVEAASWVKVFTVSTEAWCFCFLQSIRYCNSETALIVLGVCNYRQREMGGASTKLILVHWKGAWDNLSPIFRGMCCQRAIIVVVTVVIFV